MISAAVSLFLTGFVTLAGQIVLLRELSVAFFGVELIYLIGLGAWLLMTALGTILSSRRRSPAPDRAAILLILFSLFLPLCIAFLRGSRLALGGIPGAYLPFWRQMAALLIPLAPVGLLSGLLFRASASLYAEKGRTLAGAYGIESAGALAGGFLVTRCLGWGIQNFPLAVACSLIGATGALFLFRRGADRRHRAYAAGLATLMTFLLWQAGPIDRRMTAWNHAGLLDTRDSPYGRITVTGQAGQISVFTDDALAFETEGTDAELFAHLTALQHPRPQRILILGGGLAGTARELLRHRPARIDLVEIDPELVALVQSRLSEPARSYLADPAVHLVIADPRRFIREIDAAYDVILIGMPEPTSGQTNRFYTREFFRECAGHLTPNGITAIRLPTAENFWSPLLIQRTASIHQALASVFPEIVLLTGATTVIAASPAPLAQSPDILIDRLRKLEIQTRLISPPYIRYLFANDRRSDLERRLVKASVPMNTDLRPICYPYAVLNWLARFFPGIALKDLPPLAGKAEGSGYLWWLAGLGLLPLFLLSRLRPAWRRGLLVGVAGFIGMAFEAVLILAYQARQGVLYQDIGLLLMAFMAGLTVGAWVLNEAIRWTGVRHKRSRWWGAGLLAGFGLLGAVTLWFVSGEKTDILMSTSALLACAGFLVAGLLAYASLSGVKEQKRVIGPLYAADLLGGFLGSLLGSLVLIPFAGLDMTLVGMILLSAMALVLI